MDIEGMVARYEIGIREAVRKNPKLYDTRVKGLHFRPQKRSKRHKEKRNRNK
ncbi:unnamed protein product [marine sediment metagenome]|uniref:Uncharacterized protein n=1 Tax=marine sediment metagenome TaxID=412755 RepID=X1QAW3_9ZZZZ